MTPVAAAAPSSSLVLPGTMPSWEQPKSSSDVLRDRRGLSWAGRRVTVLGLGKSGLAAARLLCRAGCRVRVSERGAGEALSQAAQGLLADGVEAVELGGHHADMLEGCDLVVISPGIPPAAAPVAWATARRVPIISEIELAFQFCRAEIVAVTGTNGKSSVVTMIQHALQTARREATACGNLGTPFSEVAPGLPPSAVAVVEVSSFQLVWCDEFRPAIGAFLNVGTNHVDWHGDFANYVDAKARLFRQMRPDDRAVLNGEDPVVARIGARVAARQIWYGPRCGPEQAGRFRLDPATCRALPLAAQAVLQTGRALGLPDPLTYQAIRQFRGLEHRLERVATIRGVHVVNDAKSTTPDSFLYALERCAGPVVLILGGKDKGMDFRLLPDAIAQERVRGVVLIGEVRHRLRQLLGGSAPVEECATLEQAVSAAMGLCHAGDTLLFSPACASFDMFANFQERGRAFKQMVRQLERRAHSS
ncbi:MAG: UDP-N-acetylmuramoyl-L-alanine--D-glutamate ligase [Candidatus Omnitrophica bacterium]|nr:UDP-N-acetylmuramoyl-L-alanine--D-glutamate ligase [Candidatus Omnitrophota bacterium]